MKACPSGFRPCIRCHSGKDNSHGLDHSRVREFRPPGRPQPPSAQGPLFWRGIHAAICETLGDCLTKGEAIAITKLLNEDLQQKEGSIRGKLAREYYDMDLPVVVLYEAPSGYYLGTWDPEGPDWCSRESVERWPTEDEAKAALSSGNWTQRDTLD